MLLACGGGGGGDSSSGGNTVGVVPSLGQFSSGTKVVIKGADQNEIGSGLIGADGKASVPIGTYQGVMIVEVQGGATVTFFDEGSGREVNFPAGSVLKAIAPGNTSEIGVTLLTHAAAELTGTSTDTTVIARNNLAIAQQFGLANILAAPVLLGTPGRKVSAVDGEAGNYALLLAAIAQAAKAGGFTLQQVLAALAVDLKDGNLDGKDANTVVGNAVTVTAINTEKSNAIASYAASDSASHFQSAISDVIATTPAPAPTPAPTGSLGKNAKIIFLHHSTGGVIWDGGVANWISGYNSSHSTSYQVTEQAFPASPYPWNNYPYDYWNIWVNHAGSQPYQQNPTLEILAAQYDVIIWKHCFPVSDIEADSGSPSVGSATKTLANYKLQYAALKTKMRAFPNTRFLVWTGAALIEAETTATKAGRAQEFATWVKQTWDEPGDNIFVWDFRELETEGGLYLPAKYSAGDSHPNSTLARMAAPWLGQRIVDVIDGRGDSGSLTGH